MLKRHLRNILLFPDVNDTSGGGSSAATQQTATEASSSSAATQAAAPDSKEKDVKPQGQSLSEATDSIIASVLAKHKPESSTAEKKEAAESPGQQKTKTEEKEGEQNSDASPTDEKVEKENEAEGKNQEAIPCERFKEVNDKYVEVEAKYKELEPLAESQRSLINFCQENNISGEDFQKTLEIARLIQVDPAAALKELEPVYNALRGLTGGTLPADLQKAVDDGVLPEEYAKEIAKARGSQQFSSLQTQNTQQRLQRQQQTQFVTSVQQSIKTWSDTKLLGDPDFKPKANANSPDGKFEVFSDRLFKLMSATPPKTVADAVKLAESAYQDVGKLFAGLKPRPAATKSVSSTKTTEVTSTNGKTPFVQGGLVPNSVIEGVLKKYQK